MIMHSAHVLVLKLEGAGLYGLVSVLLHRVLVDA
jgi:hypothetical protein